MSKEESTFKKLRTSLNKGISTISAATARTVEKSKLNTQIASLEKDIEWKYASIGKRIYSLEDGADIEVREFI